MAQLDILEKMPVLVIHGDNDKIVPTENSRQLVEVLKKRNARVDYQEIPGGVHSREVMNKKILDFFD